MSTCDGKREMRQTGLVKTACGCCRCPQLRDRRFPQGRDDTRQYSADGGLAWRAVAGSRAAAAPRAKKVFSSTRSITATGTVGARRPRHIKKTAQRLPLPSRATVSQGQCALPDGSHAGEQRRHEKTMPFTPCILIKTQLSYINTTNRRDCLHRFDTPSFGDRRQGLPPRSPDRFHPSEKSALERGWGELEGEGGNLVREPRFPPSPLITSKLSGLLDSVVKFKSML